MSLSTEKISLQKGRKALYVMRLHRWLGMATGLFLLVSVSTGILLIFTEDINLRAHAPRSVASDHDMVSIGPALAEAANALPGYSLTSVRIPTDAALGWIAFFRHPATDERQVADIDPSSGRLIGVRPYGSSLFRILLDLHYHYLAGTPGKWMALLVAIGLLVLAASGVWLQRPRLRWMLRWPWRRRRARLAALSQLHRWAGLWSFLMALLWGGTALLLLATILQPSLPGGSRKERLPTDPGLLSAWPQTGELLARAGAELPGGTPWSLAPLAGPSGGVSVRLLFRDNWPWEKFGEVRFSAEGAWQRTIAPHQAEPKAKYLSAITALHFGFLGHRLTQLAYAGGGLLLLVLPLTGLLLRLQRRL